MPSTYDNYVYVGQTTHEFNNSEFERSNVLVKIQIEQSDMKIPTITEDASCLADDRYVDRRFHDLFVSVESDSTPPTAAACLGFSNPASPFGSYDCII